MKHSDFFRGRRLRSSATLREMVRETRLSAPDLMMPYFVVDTDDKNFRKEIASMPGQYQLSLAALEQQIGKAVDAGLRSLMLFGLPKNKDPEGTEAYAPEGIVQQAVRRLKKLWPELMVTTDVCLCEYTSHGHCGLLQTGDTSGTVLNDATLPLLQKVALSHAEAGADIVAPSDMMDGRIRAIRQALDAKGYENLPIMAYSAKFASAYYGPFREAADSAPQFGDRKTYQMDPPNAREALREAAADLEEGADILMVKPAGPYMDIIRQVYDAFDAPVAAYQVSGEYALIKAAGQNGWVNEEAVALEALLGIRRAGAKIIINYFTEDFLKKGLIR